MIEVLAIFVPKFERFTKWAEKRWDFVPNFVLPTVSILRCWYVGGQGD